MVMVKMAWLREEWAFMLVEPTLRFLLPKVSNHLPRQAVIQIILKHVKISTLVATVAPAPAKKWRQLAATAR